MNEYIEVNFTRNGSAWPIRKQLEDGQVEFDEPDPIPRRIAVSLQPRADSTEERLRWVRQRMGWHAQDFQLSSRAEGGALVLRGVRSDDNDTSTNLPPGFYSLRVQVEEARVVKQAANFRVKKESFHAATVDVATDDRQVNVDLTNCDDQILAVFGASELDGGPALDWLERADRRPSRKACLLNLLASLRSRPSVAAALLPLVSDFYFVSNDRAFARAHIDLLHRLEKLAADDSKPFYREGRPTAKIHEAVVDSIPAEEAHLYDKRTLLSFRGENSPSLQVVVAPPSSGVQAYVEFDLDLGNALQDVWGLIVHVGELVDGKATNHLDMRKRLAKTKAKPFLYYTVTG